jgi:FkbM family methyltransferase
MTTLIAPFVSQPLRHLTRIFTSARYRQYLRLTSLYGRTAKGQEKTIRSGEFSFTVPDTQAFLWDYQELFYNELYKFKADNETPKIVDCGANIGLSVLYFKKIYPKSTITAFEADPEIYKYLRKNLEANQVQGVNAISKAVWSEEKILSFSSQGGDAGRIDAGGDTNIVQIQAVTLEQFLNEPIDLLKIDVEGAELDVLKGAGDNLKNCKLVFVEYHSFGHKKQVLAEILSLMAGHGFRAHICPEYHSSTPFVSRPLHARMDLRLNMFFVPESAK